MIKFINISFILITLSFTFSSHAQSVSLSKNIYKPISRIPSKSYYTNLKKKLKHIKEPRQSWLKLQLSMWAVLFDDNAWAISQLKTLQAKPISSIDKNLVHLSLGRVYYQADLVKKSVQEYSKILKDSDYWFEAIEESAWAYFRLNQLDKAMAKNESLITPYFERLIRAEPYYLQALLKLKACDYPGVLKVTGLFKKRYKERILQLEQVASQKDNGSVAALLNDAIDSNLSSSSLGESLLKLPYNVHRDYKIQLALKKYHTADSVNKKTAALKNIKTRLAKMAQNELKLVATVIKKLHIVEAETIQRVHGAPEPTGSAPKITVADTANTLMFNHNSNEIWIDELDDLNYSINDCPGSKGANL